MPSKSTYYSEMTIGTANGNVYCITNYKDRPTVATKRHL